VSCTYFSFMNSIFLYIGIYCLKNGFILVLLKTDFILTADKYNRYYSYHAITLYYDYSFKNYVENNCMYHDYVIHHQHNHIVYVKII